VTIEHDAAAAEGVREEALGSGLGVSPLNRQHALGVSQVPDFARVPLLEPGDHQLSAHRAVPEQGAFRDRVEQRLLQGDSRPFTSG
jgi:hypothetical protein